MTEMTGTLRVDGAELYYKVRGNGPLLLVIQGGAGDADASDGLAERLTKHYVVLTYDRRGLSRSTLDDPTQTARDIRTHAEDAHRLLAALTTEPAFVLGSSLGGLIGLDLVARHPERVRRFVVHEPPAAELLPEPERTEARQVQRELENMSTPEEWAAVMRKIAVSVGDREAGVETPTPTLRMAANSEFFRTNDAPAAHRYTLDLAALQAASARIIAAGGIASRAAFPHRCARALAERLGVEFVEFPGDHVGFSSHPTASAARLREVLGS